jgi:exosortase A-associated hydrolase 1
MSVAELPAVIPCGADRMLGIVHAPERQASVGVVIVVGGPQYRVGSHRQFVLMARALAASGIAVLRFDCRGMGDSEGRFLGFEHIGEDIRAAVDALVAHQPRLANVVLWGLCDSASAAMLYGGTDDRIAGMILVNPWARTEAGFARAHLRHYYLKRLWSGEFWRRVGQGEFEVGAALASLWGMVRNALRPGETSGQARPPADAEMTSLAELGLGDPGLPERMRKGFESFRGPVLFLLSGNDLTAREFEDTWKSSRRWRAAMGRVGVTIRAQPKADHTWSARTDLDEAIEIMRGWVDRLPARTTPQVKTE